jgi:hypothetical protein
MIFDLRERSVLFASPRKRQGNRISCARCGGIGAALPLPLAGEGWDRGGSTSGLPGIAENVPGRLEPSPAALCERVDLSRKRERRSKLADNPREIDMRLPCHLPGVAAGGVRAMVLRSNP